MLDKAIGPRMCSDLCSTTFDGVSRHLPLGQAVHTIAWLEPTLAWVDITQPDNVITPSLPCLEVFGSVDVVLTELTTKGVLDVDITVRITVGIERHVHFISPLVLLVAACLREDLPLLT